MKLKLTVAEAKILEEAGIVFREDGAYSEDEALDLLDQVRDAEISVAQFPSGKERILFERYAAIGDKIFAQIPER